MTAGTYNITIEQGADWAMTLSLYTDSDKTTPKDISGYTARMQIRETKSSPTVIKELTTGGSGITIGGTDDNEVSLVISSSDTSLFDFLTAYYDLELVSGGVVSRLMEGTVALSKEVTR